jgi:hypothetical protein
MLLLFIASIAMAQALPTARVTWNRNPEPDIAGYEVSYGTRSGIYTKRANVGQETNFSVSGLTPNATYYFTVVAVNQAGLRSLPSAEFVYRVPPVIISNRAPAGKITSPRQSVTVLAGATAYFAADATDPDGDKGISYFWNFGANSGVLPATAKVPGPVEFQIPGSYLVTLTATDSKGLSDPTPEVIRVNVVNSPSTVAPRSGWALRYANSQEAGYEARLAFDGDPSTFWHTRWTGSDLPPPPHEIQIDTGMLRKMTGFQYVPRQDSLNVGNIGLYEFYVSVDGVNWGAPVARGSFNIGKQIRSVYFARKVARYIRLVSLTEASGNEYCSVAELNVLEVSPANRAPVALPVTASTRKNKRVKIKLRGSDPDSDPFIYQIIDRPEHGKVRRAGANLTYWPRNGFIGTDRLTYRLHDGLESSALVTVTINVKPLPRNTGKPGSPGKAGNNGADGDTKPPVTAPLPRAVKGIARIQGKKYRTLTVAKDSLPAGAKLTVEVSPDLTRWFSGKKHTTVMANNKKRIKVRDNTPFSATSKRHIRLRPVKR